MPRRSAIKRLDPRVRETVDKLIRDGRATIDDIVERLESMIGEDAPSRSSVGRYVHSAREKMARYKEAQELAKVWVGTLEEDPDSDVGRLLSEMLRTVAFQQLSTMGDDGAKVGTKDIMFLAGAIRDLASADKIAADREIAIRREVAKKAADEATP